MAGTYSTDFNPIRQLFPKIADPKTEGTPKLGLKNGLYSRMKAWAILGITAVMLTRSKWVLNE